MLLKTKKNAQGDLTMGETDLIGNYRQLNGKGQHIVSNTAEGLVESGKYKKDNPNIGIPETA